MKRVSCGLLWLKREQATDEQLPALPARLTTNALPRRRARPLQTRFPKGDWQAGSSVVETLTKETKELQMDSLSPGGLPASTAKSLAKGRETLPWLAL